MTRGRKDINKLVPVKKTVIRNGKPHIMTVYISPSQKNKVKDQHVHLPDWKIRTVNDFMDVKDEINKIKDPAERRAVKNHFLDYLQKEKGVKWDNSQDPDVNWMRAVMAAKRDISGLNSPVSPPNKQDKKPVVQHSGKHMNRDEARDKVNEVKNKLGSDALVDKIKDMGISWKEHDKPAVNKMRAFMALREHFENGGSFGESDKQTKNPKLVVKDKPKKKPKEKAPKEGTFERDYFDASPQQRVIGHLVGILPTDKNTEEYLSRLIKEGKFQLGDGQKNDYELPYKFPKAIDRQLRGRVKYEIQSPNDYKSSLWGQRNAPGFDMEKVFEGTVDEKDFKEYQQSYSNFLDKHEDTTMRQGVSGVQSALNGVEYLEDNMGIPFTKDSKKEDAFYELLDQFYNAASDKSYADKLWDDLQIEAWMDEPERGGTVSTFDVVLNISMGESGNSELARKMITDLGHSGIFRRKTLLLQDFKRGRLTKSEFFAKFYDQSKDMVRDGGSFRSGQIRDALQESVIQETVYSNYSHYFGSVVSKNFNNETVNGKAVRSKLKEVLKDFEPLTTQKSQWFRSNCFLKREISAATVEDKLKPIENWEPIPKDPYINASNKFNVLVDHVHILRKKPSVRDKYRQKLYVSPDDGKPDTDFTNAFFQNKYDNLKFPGAKEAVKKMKASLSLVPQAEQEIIKKKVEDSRDKGSHHFGLNVKNVYRIKNLPIEDKFNEIDKERNTTDFYYHGTDYDACQKIIGQSGQFKVFKNAKVGRMLGDGVYLANSSSKSAQYIGRGGFGRSQGSGVLFLCKSSLGRVKEVTMKNPEVNRRLLNRNPDVDTLAMMKPHVVNEEWAVKDEKAVLPKLWMDVERT